MAATTEEGTDSPHLKNTRLSSSFLIPPNICSCSDDTYSLFTSPHTSSFPFTSRLFFSFYTFLSKISSFKSPSSSVYSPSSPKSTTTTTSSLCSTSVVPPFSSYFAVPAKKSKNNQRKTARVTVAEENLYRCPSSNNRPSSTATSAPQRILTFSWLISLLLWFVCLQQVSSSEVIRPQKCINLSQRRLDPPPRRYVLLKTDPLPTKIDLVLDTSQRLSHRLSTNVFKILLEEGLGYQNVTTNHYEETIFNTKLASERLGFPETIPTKKGDNKLPEAMINVEVWFPTSSISNDIPQDNDAGAHASGSRFGWFIYRPENYSFPKRGLIIDHWRALRKKESIAYFAWNVNELNTLKASRDTLDSTTGRFYCDVEKCNDGIYTPDHCRQEVDCGILFVGNYSNLTNFLIRQVEDQKLYVHVAWIGAKLVPKYFTKFTKPVLMFDWYPNQLSVMENIEPIAFPVCNSYEGPTKDDYKCHYELHSLKKLIWKKLKGTADNAVEALKRFYLYEEDYSSLLRLYNKHISACTRDSSIQPCDDTQKVVEKITCEWLNTTYRNGQEIWSNWLPHDYSSKPELWIGGIISVKDNKKEINEKAHITSATYAIKQINKNDSILQDYNLRLKVQDGKCKSDQVLSSFIKYVNQDNFNQMIGILGPTCSDTVEPLAGVATIYKTVVISFSAEGAIFNEPEKYPFFFRTIPENKVFGWVYLEMFRKFGWHQVASFAEGCMRYSEYLTVLDDLILLEKKINLEHFRFTKGSPGDMTNMEDHLIKLKEKTHKIIIGDFYAKNTRKVLCKAYELGMTAEQGYVWFLPRWYASNWYRVKEDDNITCSNLTLLKALDRHMSLEYAYYAEPTHTFHEGYTVEKWQNDYRKVAGSDELPDYAGYIYDAVWTYTYAVNKLIEEDRVYAADFHNNETNKRLVELLKKTDFDGVSGKIQFKNGPSRESVIHVMQFIVNDTLESGEYKVVGKFHPFGNGSESGELKIDDDKLQFIGGDIPTDGIVAEACLFQTFSQLLGVNCDMTIVIVMIMIFSVFAILLLALFIVYKKRFEKMIPDSHWPLGELISLDEWELPREKVVINRTIGEGAFGTVYGGECQFGDNTPWVAVAVKTLKVGSTMEERLDFLGEAEMMTRLTHKNIVQLLGLCTHQEPIYMVMEFMLYGDMKIYLLARRHLVLDRSLQNDEDEVSSKRLTAMALDVSRALEYLEEHRFVHRDVACRNCLVSADRVVKLSDFGMTRAVYDHNYYRFSRRGMLPVRWMSPESLEDGIFTNMSDMWSYGVLLYEIITFGSFPFQNLKNNEVLDVVSKGNTISIPTGVKPELKRLLQNCWRRNPLDRPTFHEMSEQLSTSPRLITPCLEVPTAAIQMNDTDSVEMPIAPEAVPLTSGRRSSAPNTGMLTVRIRHTSGNDIPECNNVHLNNLSHPSPSYNANLNALHTPNSSNPPNALNSTGWNRAIQENGSGPSVEPLLPQNGDGYITSYVRLQHPKPVGNSIHFDSPNNMTAV